MLSHSRIWDAIDRLAHRRELTTSGLAIRSGLDSTSFNKSKRTGADGRLRWPSTESIAKILEATDTSFEYFLGVDMKLKAHSQKGDVIFPDGTQGIPLIGFAQAGAGGFFDDSGFPAGQGWDVVDFPVGFHSRPGIYALEIQGESMQPLYRDGDVIIVEPAAQIRRHDRVVVRTKDGEVMAKILLRHTPAKIELLSLNPEHPNRTFDLDELEWMARIIWASQ